MEFVNVLVGLIMAFFGRALYWLLVGLAGLVVGGEMAVRYLDDQPTLVIVLVALAAGVLGALLAILLQRVAFALAGFLMAGYLGVVAAGALELARESLVPAIFLIAGFAGAVVALLAMDWVLIVLSSLAGAAAVVSGLPLQQPITVVVFAAVAIGGMLFQARTRKAAPQRKRWKSK